MTQDGPSVAKRAVAALWLTRVDHDFEGGLPPSQWPVYTKRFELWIRQKTMIVRAATSGLVLVVVFLVADLLVLPRFDLKVAPTWVVMVVIGVLGVYLARVWYTCGDALAADRLLSFWSWPAMGWS